MTDAWAALAAALAIAGQEPATVEPIDDVLVVEWRHKQVRPADGAVIFSGGVVARYGPTVLRAEKLTIYQNDKRKEGLAEGNVHVDDPDGVADADRLQFDWLHQTGEGTNVTVAVEGLWVRAETLTIQPNNWVLLNAKAAPDGSKRPLFSVASPRIEYVPGSGGKANKASLSLLGMKLVTLPTYRFGGKREEDGIRLPSVSYNQGLGVAWKSSLRIDDRTRIAGGFRTKRHERTGATLEITRSLLPRNEPGTLTPQLSDFGERFAYGYFDSVYVRRPSEEMDALSFRRSSVTIGAAANQTVPARYSEQQHTKPFEITFEEARLVGGFALLGNLRYQALQEDGGPSDRRVGAALAALAPSIQLAPGLDTHVRLDTDALWGERRFMWAQVQAGLYYRPARSVRLGAAIVHGSHSGTEVFAIDPLVSTRAFHGRIDVDLGTTRLNFLTKFDFDRRKWYDNEIGISQVIGPIEPFIVFREYPRTITFGFRLRAEQAFDRLRQRLERRKSSSTVDLP